MIKVAIEKMGAKQLDKMLKASARLRKLTAERDTGWADFCIMLEGYCDAILEYKRTFNMSTATDEQINLLKLYDRDVYLIHNFIKKMPFSFINGLEAEIKRRKEEDGKINEDDV